MVAHQGVEKGARDWDRIGQGQWVCFSHLLLQSCRQQLLLGVWTTRLQQICLEFSHSYPSL